MKLTHDIKTIPYSLGSRGEPSEGSISYASIDTLVSNLREEGIVVDQRSSEIEFQYRVPVELRHSIERTATAPLGTIFPEDTTLTGFYLRDGNGLELELRNYDERTSNGAIGGPSYGDRGVICTFSLEREVLDPSAFDVVQKVTRAFRKTYERELPGELLEVLKDLGTGQ